MEREAAQERVGKVGDRSQRPSREGHALEREAALERIGERSDRADRDNINTLDQPARNRAAHPDARQRRRINLHVQPRLRIDIQVRTRILRTELKRGE